MNIKIINIVLTSVLFIITSNLAIFASDEKEIMFKKTIAIDLDGVLNNYTKYTDDIPEIKVGAKEFIENLSKDYELILFTNRSSKKACEWLINNKIDKYFKDVTNVKPVAVMYIDDRAINFNGDYNKTLKDIEKFKVHWKNY